MNTVLVIVDVQNDFGSGGPLATPDADAVMPTLDELTHGFRHVFLKQGWSRAAAASISMGPSPRHGAG